MCAFRKEFLERLSRMRREHQRTLDWCSELGLHAGRRRRSRDASPKSCPVAAVDENYVLTTDSSHHSRLAGDLVSASFDRRVRPPFRARPAPRKRVPTASPRRNCAHEERAKQLDDERPENERRAMREYAVDRYLASLSDDERWIELEGRADDQRPPCSKAGRSLVQARSGSPTKLAADGDGDGWRYRVTVPEPFSMTIRESQKAPTRSRSSAEYERQRARRKIDEELECGVRFKAAPAPATIYVPLYDELAWKSETRRRRNLAARRREHAAMQRPFAFLRREEPRLADRQRRRADISSADARAPDASFRAKPFPAHLFGSCRTGEQVQGEREEQTRRWRRAARAEQLLRSSSLPRNMTKARPSHVCDMTGDQRRDWPGSAHGITRSLLFLFRNETLKFSNQHWC